MQKLEPYKFGTPFNHKIPYQFYKIQTSRLFLGGFLSLEDLRNYQVEIQDGWTVKLNDDLTLCTLGMPSGGPAVALYLSLLQSTLTVHCKKGMQTLPSFFRTSPLE